MISVDPAGELIELEPQFLVFLDLRPGWGGDLGHRDLPVHFRMVIEELADCFETLRQALGIVHPVDPDHQVTVAEKAPDAFGGPVGFGRAGGFGETLRVDTDRVCGHPCRGAEHVDTVAIQFGAAAIVDEVTHEVRPVAR